MSVKINFTNFNVANCGSLTVYYYIDDNACKAADMRYGFSCNTINIDGQKIGVIVMGDKFNELSDNAKKFLLCHEAGHINLGHLDKFDQMYKSEELYKNLCRTSTPTIEIEADSFAVGVLISNGLTWNKVMDIFDELIEDLKDNTVAQDQIIRRKELIEYCKPNIINSIKKVAAQYK